MSVRDTGRLQVLWALIDVIAPGARCDLEEPE